MNEQFIMTLIEKFGNAKIDELVLQEGNLNLVLRKGNIQGTSQVSGNISTENISANIDAGKVQQTQEIKEVHLGLPSGHEKITSPIVATFYSSPSPDAPAFVKPGTVVKKGQTLCILEAMKMMNHLEAEFDCEILEVHATSGDFIEYGQALFSIKRV